MLDAHKKKRLRETAAAWFYRLQQIDYDHPDRSRFEAWLLESSAHQRAYSEVEEISRKLNMAQEVDRLSHALQHQQYNKRSSRLKTGITVISLALCAFIGLTAYQRWQALPLSQLTASANVGKTQTQNLEDGSKLIINSRSDVEVTYYRDKRLVSLKRGEVIFEVMPDANRPFIVDSGKAKITVLGTRFAVNRLNHLVRVSVDHGRVRVESQPDSPDQTLTPLILTDQQVAEVSRNAAPVRVSRAAEDGFSFAEGVVIFDHAEIGELSETIARYRETPLILQSTDPSMHKISARVSVNNMESFLHRLPKLLPVQVSQQGGTTVIKSQASSQPESNTFRSHKK